MLYAKLCQNFKLDFTHSIRVKKMYLVWKQECHVASTARLFHVKGKAFIEFVSFFKQKIKVTLPLKKS